MKGWINIVQIYVDGGVKDNIMYIGVIDVYGTTGIRYSKKLDVGCSHTAEELALFDALMIVSKMGLNDKIIIYSDQRTLVDMIKNEHVTRRIQDKYPKITEILNLVSNSSNISVEWIKSTKNAAHTLVSSAYLGIFYNNVDLQDNKNQFIERQNIIKKFKFELQKRELIIKDLIKTINRLNKLSIDEKFEAID